MTTNGPTTANSATYLDEQLALARRKWSAQDIAALTERVSWYNMALDLRQKNIASRLPLAKADDKAITDRIAYFRELQNQRLELPENTMRVNESNKAEIMAVLKQYLALKAGEHLATLGQSDKSTTAEAIPSPAPAIFSLQEAASIAVPAPVNQDRAQAISPVRQLCRWLKKNIGDNIVDTTSALLNGGRRGFAALGLASMTSVTPAPVIDHSNTVAVGVLAQPTVTTAAVSPLALTLPTADADEMPRLIRTYPPVAATAVRIPRPNTDMRVAFQQVEPTPSTPTATFNGVSLRGGLTSLVNACKFMAKTTTPNSLCNDIT